jgi:streptogramin lyase
MACTSGTGSGQIPGPYPKRVTSAMTYGPDGNVWFLEARKGQAGRLSPDGAIAMVHRIFDGQDWPCDHGW